MILGSFGEPVGAKIGLGASCGTHGLPKWLPERPRVPFRLIWGSFWGHLGCQIEAKISLEASGGPHGPPKGLPEIPRVPFWTILGSFWTIFGVILDHFGVILVHVGVIWDAKLEPKVGLEAPGGLPG